MGLFDFLKKKNDGYKRFYLPTDDYTNTVNNHYFYLPEKPEGVESGDKVLIIDSDNEDNMCVVTCVETDEDGWVFHKGWGVI